MSRARYQTHGRQDNKVLRRVGSEVGERDKGRKAGPRYGGASGLIQIKAKARTKTRTNLF